MQTEFITPFVMKGISICACFYAVESWMKEWLMNKVYSMFCVPALKGLDSDIIVLGFAIK
jgi:hypothetical protein